MPLVLTGWAFFSHQNIYSSSHRLLDSSAISRFVLVFSLNSCTIFAISLISHCIERFNVEK